MSAKLKRMFGTTQVQSAFQLSSRVRTTPSQIHWSGMVRACAKPIKKKSIGAARTAENAPPKVVFHEEVAEVANRDQDDRGGFQPVGVVNGGSWATRMRGAVRFCAQSCAFGVATASEMNSARSRAKIHTAMTIRDPETLASSSTGPFTGRASGKKYRRARHRRSYFSPRRYHTAFLAKHEATDQATLQGGHEDAYRRWFRVAYGQLSRAEEIAGQIHGWRGSRRDGRAARRQHSFSAKRARSGTR